MSADVLLGFEVGTGEEVRVPIAHMIATGQTQLAGKTTAFEGLVLRGTGVGGARAAIAFRTKRGEGAFTAGWRQVPAFFRERCDWQFVESIVGAVMRQGMKFERAWVIKASRNCDTLAEVRRKARNLMNAARGNFDRDMYMLLGEYLDLVLPLLSRIPRAAAPDISSIVGPAVMDLSEFPLEVQMLVIHSTLTWVYEHEKHVDVVVPEAWEIVPQKKDSPAKVAVVALARKGAALGNLLKVDSQDLAGIDKEIVRQMRVYLLGVQRERNEIKRTLDHIPAGMKKPKADQLATLGRGQFFACWDDQIVKVYAMPAWATVEQARAAARAGNVVPRPVEVDWDVITKDDPEWARRADPGPAGPNNGSPAREPDHNETEEEPVDKEQEKRLEHLLGRMEKVLHDATADKRPGPEPEPTRRAGATAAPLPTGDDEELLFRRFRDRLLRDPVVIKVLKTEKVIEVEVKREVLSVDGTTMQGRVALMVKDGWMDDGEGKSGNQVWLELRRRGYPSKSNAAPTGLYDVLSKLAEDGFLTYDLSSKRYSAIDGAGRRIKEAG